MGKAISAVQQMIEKLISPSPKIEGRDQRRQASLLSAFLLSIIVISAIVELVTIPLIGWDGYTGYRQTFAGAFLLLIIYFISRTQHVKLAARLAVIIASLGVFVSGWAEPKGVLGGLFDFLILPLWLGSLYLGLTELFILVVLDLTALLLFPSISNTVTLNDILVGPFSFVFATSILLFIVTRHRNMLEDDRRQELANREHISRRDAARTKSLLRVAGRLNAQLDPDALLTTLCEEVSKALDTPIAIVSLYDQKRNVLIPAAAAGLPSELIHTLSPVGRSDFDRVNKERENVFSIDDIQALPGNSPLQPYKKLNFRSAVVASMEYEKKLIGVLSAITLKDVRNFTNDELLLLRGLSDQAALAITNTRLYNDARRRLENLQALRRIDTAIATNHDLQTTLDVLLENILEQLHVDAAIVLLLDQEKQELKTATSKGVYVPTFHDAILPVGEGIAGRAAQQNRIIQVPDLGADPVTSALVSALNSESFTSYFAVPLAIQGRVKGVLEIFHRSLLNQDEEWFSFLETLAGQAAIAIESAALFEDLQKINHELSKAYDSTIEGWSRALDLRDKETEGHTRRVTDLTLELARFFGFREDELIQIRRGSLLHDIGKMGVPDKILFKEGELEPDEWDVMKRHPVHAHEMLRDINHLHRALDIPYCHHEKWDGTGYPRGLKGEDIPLAARIFAVADVWDALTSDRPYRSAWTAEKALTYIQEQIGKHFDPQVAETFLKLIQKRAQNRIRAVWKP